MHVRLLFKNSDYLALSKPVGQLLDTPFFKLKFPGLPPVYPISPLPAQIGGVALFARSEAVLEQSVDRLKTGTFWRRNFQVIVQGKYNFREKQGCLRIPLIKKGNFYYPDSEGVTASTTWKFLKISTRENLALLEMEPLGSTPAVYQIRAHAIFGLKLAVVGDTLPEAVIKDFGISRSNQKPVMIYCSETRFATSGGEIACVRAAPPEAMTALFCRLGWEAQAEVEVTEVEEKPGNSKVKEKVKSVDVDLFAQLR